LIDSCFTAAYLRKPFGYQMPLGMTTNTRRNYTQLRPLSVQCLYHPNRGAGPRGENLEESRIWFTKCKLIDGDLSTWITLCNTLSVNKILSLSLCNTLTRSIPCLVNTCYINIITYLRERSNISLRLGGGGRLERK